MAKQEDKSSLYKAEFEENLDLLREALEEMGIVRDLLEIEAMRGLSDCSANTDSTDHPHQNSSNPGDLCSRDNYTLLSVNNQGREG